MSLLVLPFLAAALSLGCGRGAPPEVATPRAFALAYTSNVDGEIEPCG